MTTYIKVQKHRSEFSLKHISKDGIICINQKIETNDAVKMFNFFHAKENYDYLDVTEIFKSIHGFILDYVNIGFLPGAKIEKFITTPEKIKSALDELILWIEENCQDEVWYSQFTLWFKDSKDIVAFKLRWC
jgi:hypothetical protein